MNIGYKVYVTDAKTKKVFKATISGIHVSDSGYGLVSVVDDNDNKTTTELAHVHETKGTAEKFIQEKTKYIDQAEKVLKDAKEKMDKLRIKVIGEPKHEYLSERIKRGNK